LSDEDRAREHLVFALRRLEGITRADFAERTGFDLDTLAGSKIAKFGELGMLADDGNRVRLTREGLLISDSLWPELL
jgi:oxygen-independent coproporphyrinogen-3 oxidase